MTHLSHKHVEGGTLEIPEAPHKVPETPFEQIDQAVEDLRGNAAAWTQLDVQGRIDLIDALIETTVAVADEWVEAAIRAKRLPADHPVAGEDYVNGPYPTVRNLRMLKNSLQQIQQYGRPQPPGPVTTLPDGRIGVGVMPADLVDRALFAGFTAEVRLQDGVNEDNLDQHMARIYQPGYEPEPKVSLVLGAGNVSSIAPTDVFYKLFVEDEVVVLKMNPVNEYVGPFLEEALAPLVDGGFLRFVYGGAKEGAYLSDHPGIDTLHITGSDRTHDAIVFGPGEEGQKNKAAGKRINDRPFSCELGNVTPVIVVPGPWSDADIDWQGENLATMLVNNAGFNCIATRVIVQHKSWARRRALNNAVRKYLDLAPQRYPYYPGAEDRYKAFIAQHPEAERYGSDGPGEVPWTFIPDLDRNNADDICFTTESFAGVMGEVPLDAPRSIPDYIAQAVEFCNSRLWGSLGASIIVHPKSLKDPAVAEALEAAITDLEYGNVVVNHWSGVGFGFMSTSWGAYPGHSHDDIQSGIGIVHNTFMFEDVVKSVVRGPFRMPVKLPIFLTHKRPGEFFKAAMHLEADPSPAKVPPVLWAAMRG